MVKIKHSPAFLQFIFSVLWILSIPLISNAQSNDALYKKFNDLFQSGQSTALFEQVLKDQNDLEGDTTFDYFFGISSIDNGHVSEGVFSLERVLTSGEKSPYFNQYLVQIELARGYFLLGDNNKAQLLFEQSLTLEPPQAVITKINSYLKAIKDKEKQYHSQFSGYVQQSFGHDSNVNALADDTFNLFNNPNFSTYLAAESDLYSETKLGIDYQHPLTRKNSLFVNAGYFNHNNFDVDSLDNDGFNLLAGSTFKHEKGSFKASYYHQHYNLDDNSYRKIHALLGEYKYGISDNTVLTGNANLIKYNFKDNSSLDALEFNYRAGAIHQLQTAALKPLLYFQLYFGDTQADEEDDNYAMAITERSFSGINIGTQLKVHKDVTLNASFDYQESDYQGAHPLTGYSTIRNDHMRLYNLDLQWDISKQWKALGKLAHIDNQSSITLYDYEKTYGQVGVRYEF